MTRRSARPATPGDELLAGVAARHPRFATAVVADLAIARMRRGEDEPLRSKVAVVRELVRLSFEMDAFGALVAWRERGVAPEKLVATAGPNTPWPGRTRLLCPYPQQPRRTGMEMEKAESFGCFHPPAEQAAAR